MQRPSYLLWCTPPFSTFINSLVSFNFSFFQMLGHLLNQRLFDGLEGPLVHKQTSFPIIFGGIRFISITTIALTTYLRNWPFVTSIIAINVMVDQHPFLLEALTWVNNNTFLFQQHFKATCDLLPPQHTHVFFFLNNSLGTKWFDFKIPF